MIQYFAVNKCHGWCITQFYIAKSDEMDEYFCRSFFPKEETNYTAGHIRYTLLYKEKIDLATGEVLVQYDRLTPKKQT